jgi:acetylornithine deacetylase
MSIDPWPQLSQAIAARRDLAIKLTQEMVRLPSHEGEEQVQEYITQWWKNRGVDPDVWEPNTEELKKHRGYVEVGYDYTKRRNVVVLFNGQGGGRSLTLNGHMDVVPVDPAGAWTYGDPWGGQLVDGRIYGRGALDMKSGLAAGMILLDALRETGVKLKGDLQMQFVVDEENGGNGTLAAITRGYKSDGTIFLDAMISMEDQNQSYLVVSSRGAHFFRITVPGMEGGIEFQFSMPNAIEKAIKLFQAVQSYALWRSSHADHPLYVHDPTKIPAAICKIHAGNWPSTLPAQCIMEGSIECLPGEDIDQVMKEFEEYILEVSRQDEWMKSNPPIVEWFGLRYEAGQTPVDHPLVIQLSGVIEELTGRRPVVVGGGGSDVRLPILYAQSATVLFGPTGGPIHSTNEYVEVDSIMQLAQVLGKFILKWCEVA